MKERASMKRALSLLLTLALVLGLLPTSAFAARDGEVPSIIEYKAMSLTNLLDKSWISRYEYAQERNTFYDDVNLNIPSLLRLVFTIEKSQNVNLVLYKLDESVVQHPEDDDDYAHLEYYYDPDADDFGASVPEEFLGERIGYINGIRVLDNIVKPDPNLNQVDYKRIDDEDWTRIINDAAMGNLLAQPMEEIYAFGFKGEKLPERVGEDAAAMLLSDEDDLAETNNIPTTEPMDEAPAQDVTDQAEPPVDETAPADAAEPDSESDTEDSAEPVALLSLDSALDAPDLADAPADDSEPVAPSADAPEVQEPSEDADASEPPVESDVPSEPSAPAMEDEAEPSAPADAEESQGATEAPLPSESSEVVEESATPTKPRSLLPISDVLYDPNPISLFALNDASSEWAIENYVLWDGSVVSNGTAVMPDYDDGYYVIVLEPCREDAAVYNSFLGFESTTSERDPFPMTPFTEALEIAKRQETEDPVNLLSGSFNWNYTDMALYGKEDLAFTRYYESTSADRNFGLGNGWSSNYTADLTVRKFYAEVHLAQNHTLYFDMDFDGEYRACGDWTFRWDGDGYELKNVMTNTVYTFGADEMLESISELGKAPLVFTHSDDRITSVTNGVDTFTFAYNADKNLETVTDSVGRSIELAYDGDLLTSVENPDADSLLYTYTTDGYLETVKNFKGQVYVENTYDADGRVTHQFAADMGTFDFTYDMEGRHNTCTGTDGYLLEIWYDELHRITKSTNAAGTMSYTYNDLNQVTSQTDREGNTTSYDHDAEGNISKITYPDGTTEEFVYDANRKVTSFTDRNGVTVSYTYNAEGRPTAITDGRGKDRKSVV